MKEYKDQGTPNKVRRKIRMCVHTWKDDKNKSIQINFRVEKLSNTQRSPAKQDDAYLFMFFFRIKGNEKGRRSVERWNKLIYKKRMRCRWNESERGPADFHRAERENPTLWTRSILSPSSLQSTNSINGWRWGTKWRSWHPQKKSH